VTYEDLVAAFDGIESEAFRLETRQSHAGVVDPGWDAWKAGRPLPRRTPDNNEFLAKVSVHAAAGRKVRRVLIVDWPLTDYKRYELCGGFDDNIAAGEEIYAVDRDADPRLGRLQDDFWLFDGQVVAVMRYDDSDRPLPPATPDEPLKVFVAARDLVCEIAAPLHAWAVEHQERLLV